VREAHHPELRRALEEGVWPDGEPPSRALTMDGGIPQPDRVRIRAWAEVAGRMDGHRPARARRAVAVPRVDDGLRREAPGLEAPASAQRAAAAHVPESRVRSRCACATTTTGCRSWLEITRDLPFEGTPVLSDEEFDRASEEIAAIAESNGVAAFA